VKKDKGGLVRRDKVWVRGCKVSGVKVCRERICGGRICDIRVSVSEFSDIK
jgi:hypothetical protein